MHGQEVPQPVVGQARSEAGRRKGRQAVVIDVPEASRIRKRGHVLGRVALEVQNDVDLAVLGEGLQLPEIAVLLV